MVVETKEKIVRTVCPICAYHMLDVKVKDNEVVDISASPVAGNKGHSVKECQKAQRALRWAYRDDANRVTHPMIRSKRGGEWQQISWDNALDTLAGRLKELRQKEGPKALDIGKAHIL